MPLDLCLVPCSRTGVCQKLTTRLVSVAELKNPEFVRDLRNDAASFGLTPDGWYPRLEKAGLMYAGRFVTHSGQEVFLTMRPFDKCEHRYWFRDLNVPVPAHVTPRVRREARGRMIVLGSILKAYFPIRAALWGVRPANMDAQSKAVALAWPDAPITCPLHKSLLMPTRAGRMLFERQRKPANDNDVRQSDRA